jgi:hypothetical protein
MEGTPETFNFLGFTHIYGTNRKTDYFIIIRQTISKRRAARLKQLNAELRRRLHDPLAGRAKWLQSVVRGYFQYHAVPGNEKSLGQFRTHALRLCGCVRIADEANEAAGPGNASWIGSEACYLKSASYTRTQLNALTPSIRGKNRVR